MIHPGRNVAAAGHPALALDDEVVAVDRRFDPVGAQPRGGRGEPVGFFHPQLGEPAHPRRALRKRRGDREDRIFVDHARRAFRRNLDALERARPHAQIRHLLPALLAAIEDLDPRPHLA